eukprot:COSAG01_NODE_3787_length_5693_cov_17.714337_7_plen_522_part_00
MKKPTTLYLCCPPVPAHAARLLLLAAVITFPTFKGVASQATGEPEPEPELGDWTLLSTLTLLSSTPRGLSVAVSLFGIIVGLFLNSRGYKYWKYTIGLLGFLVVGLICAAGAFLSLAHGCLSSQATSVVTDQEFNAGTSACVRMYLIAGVAGVVGGCIGANIFWRIYQCVVFCLGCQVGMYGFMVVLVGATASVIVHDATGVVDILIQKPDLFYVLAFLALVVGCIVGGLSLKFQKVGIMAGTAYLGSQMIVSGTVNGLADSSTNTSMILSIFILLLAIFGFFVQWKFTSQGVNIDPKTGAVTVVVITPRQPAYPATTYAHPATTYSAANNLSQPLMQEGSHNGAASAGLAAQLYPPHQHQRSVEPLKFKLMDRAILQGLQSQHAHQFNGQKCVVLDYDIEKSRYIVQLKGGDKMSVRPENVAVRTRRTPAKQPVQRNVGMPSACGPPQVAASIPVQSNTISLNYLLTQAKLTHYELGLNEAGLVESKDILDADDSELRKYGFKKAEVKRLRRIMKRLGLA